MRPVMAQEFVTLDGVMEAPGDASQHPRGAWQLRYVGEEHLDIVVEEYLKADALLLGRRTYDSFAGAWPSRTGMKGLADRINTMPKYVASTTLVDPGWNTTVLRGDLVAAVTELKQQPGNGLLVPGSGALVDFLARHDLVDVYQLWIHPIVLGAGERLFRDGRDMTAWALADVRTTSEGVVILTYRRE